MSRLTRSVRFFTLLLAAIQFAVPAAVSVVDGALAGSGRESRSHIESVGANDCASAHSADCLLCRFLSTTLARTGTSAPAVIGTDLAQPPTMLGVAHVAAAQHGFNSRAPPTSPG